MADWAVQVCGAQIQMEYMYMYMATNDRCI